MESSTFTVFRHGEDAQVNFDPQTDKFDEPRICLTTATGVRMWIYPQYYRFEGMSVGHVKFARQLVEASQAYLAELERAYEHDQGMEDAA